MKPSSYETLADYRIQVLASDGGLFGEWRDIAADDLRCFAAWAIEEQIQDHGKGECDEFEFRGQVYRWEKS